jgi:hypothetical protein
LTTLASLSAVRLSPLADCCVSVSLITSVQAVPKSMMLAPYIMSQSA